MRRPDQEQAVDADALRRLEPADLLHPGTRRAGAGLAILGAVGAGLYPDIQTAAENMVHVESQIEPDPAMHEAYKFYVDKYIESYPRMKELMHEVSHHEASQDRDQPPAHG